MLLAYVWAKIPGPRLLLEKIPYEAAGLSVAEDVDVAVRKAPRNDPGMLLPLPSPKLNQIWLPELPSPSRKLHAVRFSTVTPAVLNTSTPLRPLALPPERGPKS